MAENENDEVQRRKRLRALAVAAGFTVRRIGTVGYEMAFHGKYRDFDVRASLGGGWLSLSVYILELPPAGAVRTKLFEQTAAFNDDVALANYGKSEETLVLQLQYREEHLDPTVFENLVTMIRDVAEEHYPMLFRIVSEQDALSSLEQAFQRPSLTGGSE